MRKIEIKDSNGKMVSVEVSEEVYAVLQEENKQQERQRNEKRRHFDTRELSDYIIHQKRVAENLEDYCVNREQLKEIQRIVSTCTKTQQRRFYLNRICGYSYTEIAQMEKCHMTSVKESIVVVLKKIKKIL
ncbi:MAG: sigma-70 family RNA polymerase sigma factor [Firmicutes bacterium]|nr:sigma-70 family RNA polymerase sigma factor [Bacillota bacterium]